MLPDLSKIDLAAAVEAVKRELAAIQGLPEGCIHSLPSYLVGRGICELNPNIIGDRIGVLYLKCGQVGVLLRVATYYVLRFSGPVKLSAIARVVTAEVSSSDLQVGSVNEMSCHLLSLNAVAKMVEVLNKTENRLITDSSLPPENVLAELLANHTVE